MINKTIYLTHSSIETYNQCKRLFKNRYIDKINFANRDINKYLAFDISLHSTLSKFNKIYPYNNKSYKLLMNLLTESWISRGYLSNDEESQFKIRATKALEKFLNNPLDVGVENIIVDKMLQENLTSSLTLYAKVDKLHELEDKTIELVDYKTGSYLPPMQKFNCKTQIALLIALSYSNLGIYPDLISFYYLMYNKKITFKINNDFIDFSKSYLKFILDKIENEELYNCCKSPCLKINCKYYKLCSKEFIKH